MSWASWARAWGDSWGSSWGDADVELYQGPGETGPQAALLSSAWAAGMLESSRFAGVESSTPVHIAALQSARSSTAWLRSSSSSSTSLLSSYAANAEVSE